MLPCLNQITLGRTPPPDLAHLAHDLAAVRAGGWPAIELWLRHWDGIAPDGSWAAAKRVLDEAGLVAAGGCGQPGLFFASGKDVPRSRDDLRRRLEQCQALGAPHLVVTPGPVQAGTQLTAADLDRAAENLRAAGEMAAPFGMRLGIEFLKGARLVNNLPTALRLVEMVGHPNVGVLVDTFHLYAGLSKLEDLDALAAHPERLFFVHVDDVPASIPRELWTDPDRVLPGEGSLPLPAIFDAIGRTNYAGYVSLELFNEAFAARWADDPAAASRAAYASVVPLLSKQGR